MTIETNIDLAKLDMGSLRILRYPDPRLMEVCAAAASFGDPLRGLVGRMFELMLAAHGVGLAAPQVGVNLRLFVASPTFQPDDRRVYVNPRIVAMDGWQEEEEGCLSFPGIACKIKRRGVVTVEACDIDGRGFQETGDGLTARIFQHEIDHLNGQLLIDRMGSVARLAHRRALKELRQRYAESTT